MLKGNPTGACMRACCQCRDFELSQHTTNLDTTATFPAVSNERKSKGLQRHQHKTRSRSLGEI